MYILQHHVVELVDKLPGDDSLIVKVYGGGCMVCSYTFSFSMQAARERYQLNHMRLSNTRTTQKYSVRLNWFAILQRFHCLLRWYMVIALCLLFRPLISFLVGIWI